MSPRPVRSPLLTLLLIPLALAGCNRTPPPSGPALDLQVETWPAAEITPFGTDSTLDVGTWNLEWFGDTERGPDHDALQLRNVAMVMAGLGVDLWSVQEVTSGAQFDTLVARLDGFDGVLADDPRVVGGAEYYSDFGGNELKVGVVYRRSDITVDSARVILVEHDHAFAGRPPVEVHLRASGRDTALAVVAILLHAKAGAGADDRIRRETGADALKAYLDARYPDTAVLVIGDINDDIDVSIAGGVESPYAAFVADSADYRFLTAALTEAGISSTVTYSDVIDHQLATDELAALYVEGSAAAYQPDFGGYGETTSDHYPVLTRFDLPAGGTIVTATYAAPGIARLTWTGAAGARVDVYRNGERVVTTENDGSYTDEVPAGTGDAIYRVCDAGTSACSNEALAQL